MKVIARIRNPYDGKFGVPRQSGLVEQVVSTIVFEPEYRAAEALRGIEEFSHLWLIWAFDRTEREDWSPTVRPPRLGGNQRIGVFATRSPYRPNAVGLSCVKLLAVEKGNEGTVLKVAGADLMNDTPIYDIKPYLPYADCRPEATGGFTDRTEKRTVRVEIPEELAGNLNTEELEALKAVLREDPRPAYQDDPERTYAFEFGGRHVEFRVKNDRLEVIKLC
ncbi:MAG: tRNA (N6-threonylcarbamoyladenosine(37)-N6)-methyltransferase TrmO [Clostridiales bacterium]|nr:tRNA (N6-threonylcarbamoyladenosine(37)-N6)-methyltransferase TrmO [Clostridiales bacterium]